jgi:hypothetical protein
MLRIDTCRGAVGYAFGDTATPFDAGVAMVILERVRN